MISGLTNSTLMRVKRSPIVSDKHWIMTCVFLCEKGKDEEELHRVSTFDADANIRTMINELSDSHLHVKIVGDLIAMGPSTILNAWWT